ncbi:MAG: hypothetical protein RMK99_15445, partial [Anaerolineales bacterium]|nr:hypothetical protein [Anaerolineales bacterium]
PPRPTPAQAVMFSDDEVMLPAPDEDSLPPGYVPPPPDDLPYEDDLPVFEAPPAQPVSAPSPATMTPAGNGSPNINGSPANAMPAAPARPGGHTSRETAAPFAHTPNALQPQRVIVTLQASGDSERDRKLLRAVYRILTTQRGPDEFEFLIRENGHQVQMRFPNCHIAFTAEVRRKLAELVGEAAIQVQAGASAA